MTAQQKRNFIASLFLSQGVPMLVSGDEMGKTQNGNNNGYCQDNEISWLDWKDGDRSLLAFTRQVIRIRCAHPVFSRSRWFKGQLIPGSDLKDIAWFLPEGDQMTEEHWANAFAKSMAIFFNGSGFRMVDARGEQIIDDNFYIIFNAYHEKLDYRLPCREFGLKWVKVIDTSEPCAELLPCEPKSFVSVNGRCIVLLQCLHPDAIAVPA